MIILDTHIWRYFVDNDLRNQLRDDQLKAIHSNIERNNLGLSVISCWEIAKKVEKGKLDLQGPVRDWIHRAVSYIGIRLLPLSVDVALEATSLPGEFHNDPADQIIVATARLYNCKLVTNDSKILDYPHVETIH